MCMATSGELRHMCGRADGGGAVRCVDAVTVSISNRTRAAPPRSHICVVVRDYVTLRARHRLFVSRYGVTTTRSRLEELRFVVVLYSLTKFCDAGVY